MIQCVLGLVLTRRLLFALEEKISKRELEIDGR